MVASGGASCPGILSTLRRESPAETAASARQARDLMDIAQAWLKRQQVLRAAHALG
jgi:hypothetical protein